MKRVYLLFSLLFFSWTISAQEYSLSFKSSDFNIKEVENGYCQISANRLNGFFLSFDVSQPQIPYKIINILLPPGEEFEGLSVNYLKSLFKENIMLVPNEKPTPTSAISGKRDLSNIIYKADSYPDSIASYLGTIQIGGYKIAKIKVSPFIYTPQNKTLYLVNQVNLKYSTKQMNDILSGGDSDSYMYKDVLSDIIVNPNVLSAYPETYSTRLREVGINDVVYLIITSDAMASSFNNLVKWKTQKGVPAKVITLSQIYSQYSGSTNQEKIKRCINDYYQNRGLKWVLLGGDNTIVPVQGCFGRVDGSTGVIQYNNMPTDLYYAVLSGPSFIWDANGNGIYGEADDGCRYEPQVYLSRVPVRTASDVSTFTNKVLEYEKTPGRGSYFNSMLTTGTSKSGKYASNGKSFENIKGDYLFNDFMRNRGWNGTQYKLYDTETSFSGGASYQFNVSNLSTQLNRGYHFVHNDTHGSSTSIELEAGSFNTSHINELRNTDKFIFVTTACQTNNFDSADPCFSEAMIRNSQGGCIAYFGSSREGWSYDNEKYGSSLQYNCNFFRYLFDNPSDWQLEQRLGYVASNAKVSTMGASDLTDDIRFLNYGINTIGDPELPIYTEQPSSFTKVNVSKNGNTISVNTGISDSRCTITACSTSDNGKSYYSVAYGTSARFLNVNVPVAITITKPNYRPYQTTLTKNKSQEIDSNSKLNLPFDAQIKCNAQIVDISVSNAETVSVTVYSMDGKYVLGKKMSSAKFSLNIPANGSYMIMLINERGEKVTKKIQL